MATPLRNRTRAYSRFREEYTAARAWIEAASLLQECFRFVVLERSTFAFGGADDSGAGNNEVLKTGLRPATAEIRSSQAGELLTERGTSPLQDPRRFAMTKMIDIARPSSPSLGRCPQVAAREPDRQCAEPSHYVSARSLLPHFSCGG
jgi:hypothetical protein